MIITFTDRCTYLLSTKHFCVTPIIKSSNFYLQCKVSMNHHSRKKNAKMKCIHVSAHVNYKWPFKFFFSAKFKIKLNYISMKVLKWYILHTCRLQAAFLLSHTISNLTCWLKKIIIDSKSNAKNIWLNPTQ